MSGHDEAPAPVTSPALREQFSALGQVMARIESAATEKRWADCAVATKELLSLGQRILQRAHVLAQLQADGTIPR